MTKCQGTSVDNVFFVRCRVLKDKINSAQGPLKVFPEVNTHASPFGGNIWVYAVLLWATISMIFNACEKFSIWYN